MQYKLCLITVALAHTVLATDVDLTMYANGNESDEDVTCSNQQVTYQYNNLPSFGGVLPNRIIYPTTCVEVNNLIDGCEVEFWDDGGDEEFDGNYQCYGNLLETNSDNNVKFLIPTAACVQAFCGIDATTAWGFTVHQGAKCADSPGYGDYTGTESVTTCTQFEGPGLESVFFQAYGNEYTLETYSDIDCTTNKQTTQGGCLDGIDDNQFYLIVNV